MGIVSIEKLPIEFCKQLSKTGQNRLSSSLTTVHQPHKASTPTHRNVRSYISVDREMTHSPGAGYYSGAATLGNSNRLKKQQQNNSRAFFSHDDLLSATAVSSPPPSPYYFGSNTDLKQKTYRNTPTYHHESSSYSTEKFDSPSSRGLHNTSGRISDGLEKTGSTSHRVQSRVSRTYESSQHYKGNK